MVHFTFRVLPLRQYTPLLPLSFALQTFNFIAPPPPPHPILKQEVYEKFQNVI